MTNEKSVTEDQFDLMFELIVLEADERMEPIDKRLKIALVIFFVLGMFGWLVGILLISHEWFDMFLKCTFGLMGLAVLNILYQFLCMVPIWNDRNKKLSNLWKQHPVSETSM